MDSDRYGCIVMDRWKSMDGWMGSYVIVYFLLIIFIYSPAPDLSVTDLLHNALDIALLNYAKGK